MQLIICFVVLVFLVGYLNEFGFKEWIGFLGILLIAGIITYPLQWKPFIKELIKKSQEK